MCRYFAEAAATLACLIYGVRDGCAADGSPTRDYWITDGLYGSMNSLLYDHAVLACHPLGQPAGARGALLPTTVFGPTCAHCSQHQACAGWRSVDAACVLYVGFMVSVPPILKRCCVYVWVLHLPA